jgi:hypothetical protein
MGKSKTSLKKGAVASEDGKGKMKIKALARKTIQVLEKEGYAPNLRAVREVAQEVFPKEDPEVIVRAISKEYYERTKGFFEALWPSLGVFSPPIEVEEALREGRGVSVWLSQGRKVDFVVEDEPQKRFSFRRQISIPLWIESQITGLEVVVGNIYARVRDGRSNVFFRTDRGEKKAIEAVRHFRSLFEALDLADLEKALENLANLPPWEKGRVEGGYFMVKTPYFSALRRGLVLGDPTLDGALFRGEPVVLSYPEGTQVFLEASFVYESEEYYMDFGKLKVRIKWRGEVVRREASIRRRDFVCDDPISSILRHELSMASHLTPNCSPAMCLFLRELSEQDNILEALGDREFHRKVWREVGLEALASF